MEPPKHIKITNAILDDPIKRYCEIYIIKNILNGKIYVGQAVSHILNHKRYRPYGYKGRFKGHIYEAFSSKKNQSYYLNNAIRKYGPENFEVELIEYCLTSEADEREIFYINQTKSLYPNGYNLKIGGKSFTHSDESKKRLSNGVAEYFKEQKIKRFKNIKNIDEDIEKYIKPLKRNNKQYGWYVYIEKCKADFGGVHIPLQTSRENAIAFINKIKESFGETP